MNGSPFPSGKLSRRPRSLRSVFGPICTAQHSAPRVGARRRRSTDHIKLIQRDDDLLDAQAPNEHKVLSCLATTTETGFKLSIRGVNNEQCTVCLSRPGDHVGYKIFVAWCVENGEGLRW